MSGGCILVIFLVRLVRILATGLVQVFAQRCLGVVA